MNVKQITKRVLSESLKDLMRKKPLDRISTDEICSNAGTSRRNFYRHFSDKYALLEWIYYVDFCVDVSHRDEWTVLDYLPAICRHYYQDRQFYANAFSLRGQNSFREYCYERLYPLLHHDFADAFQNEEEEEFFLRRIANVQFDSFEKWLRSDPCMEPDEYAAYCRDCVRRLTDILFRVAHTAPLDDKPSVADLFGKEKK